MFSKKYHIHFIGIGGIGMSGIAELLHYNNYCVSGSDIQSNDITERLRRLGINIRKGHQPIHVKGADVVVVSTAVRDDNPELIAAKKNNITVIPRALMLSEIIRSKYSIAVSGAHGKTTTTAIISSVLESGGFDPGIIIGGKLKSRGINAKVGSGDYIVVEADESDGSLLYLYPSIAVVTNIDKEHLDYYKDIEDIKKTFLRFLDQIPFYGFRVLCYDNEYIREILPQINGNCITYGFEKNADLQAKNISIDSKFNTGFQVRFFDKILGDVNLNLPGIHNVYNALSGIAVGLKIGMDFKDIARALSKLEGVKRRLEIKGNFNGVLVIDDYGHHPSEIITTIKTIKDSWSKRRLVVVFQPHRYSRTKALLNEFSNSFTLADSLLILPTYSAGENKDKGISSIDLYKKIKENGREQVFYEKTLDTARQFLKNFLTPGDVLLTLGAGDVWMLSENW